jgi:hypothetical protein
VQNGGYEAAREITTELLPSLAKKEIRSLAFKLLRSAKKAQKKGWQRPTIWFNGVCYGLHNVFDVAYAPLFGEEKIKAKDIGGYEAMDAAREAAFKTANQGRWPYNASN